jgi:predicted nucleic acid-binding Zn ribbon protein
MPTYNYNCTNSSCTEYKQILEVVHRITEDKPNCVECNEQLSVVHLSTPLVQYKGKWFCKGKEY